MSYRDDLDAALARADALQRDNAALSAEVTRLRSTTSTPPCPRPAPAPQRVPVARTRAAARVPVAAAAPRANRNAAMWETSDDTAGAIGLVSLCVLVVLLVRAWIGG